MTFGGMVQYREVSMNSSDQMDQAMVLFKQGDNRSARRLAVGVRARDTGEEGDRARDVLKRTGVDPYVFLPAAIGLMVWIIELISM